MNINDILSLTLIFFLFELETTYQVSIDNNLNKKLALEVLQTVTNKSTVVSSFAVRLSLCKLASVAEGEAKKELLSALGFKSEDMIETATYRRLKDLVTLDDINNNTTMILVSAAHFKGTWEIPFDVRHTTNKKFHFINKKISLIPMMNINEEYLFYDDGVNDVKMLKINLASFGTTVMFVVPNSAQGLPGFLTKLYKYPDLLQHSTKLMSWKRLRVYLPKFKIKTFVDWMDFLKRIGITKIFDLYSSGLETILKKNSTTKNISLNKAKQKVFLEIDEMGLSRHQPKIDPEILNHLRMGPGIGLMEFNADRPFYFIVTMEHGKEVHELFNGVYYGPE